MDNDMAGRIALHRWAVIAEVTSDRLTPAERGALVRRDPPGHVVIHQIVSSFGPLTFKGPEA